MKLRIPNSKYHSWYLCQISQQIMLLPTLIKSKMATMFRADVTVLQRRHHPKNIPHISCREDQRLPTEGKIISKYCNTSKLKGRSSINTLPPPPPSLPTPHVPLWGYDFAFTSFKMKCSKHIYNITARAIGPVPVP